MLVYLFDLNIYTSRIYKISNFRTSEYVKIDELVASSIVCSFIQRLFAFQECMN